MFLLWRSAAASICFLLGAASLGLAIVWLIGAYDVATRRTGSVSHWFILAISSISGAIGAVLLKAGFSTINRQDKTAIRCLSAAFIILALGLLFVALQ
jgi:hypothetical protein